MTPAAVSRIATCAVSMAAPALAGPDSDNTSPAASRIDRWIVAPPDGAIWSVAGWSRLVATVTGCEEPSVMVAEPRSETVASRPTVSGVADVVFGTGDGLLVEPPDELLVHPVAKAPVITASSATVAVPTVALPMLRGEPPVPYRSTSYLCDLMP